MSKDEYKFILARLNVLDAALECVIKRQGVLARIMAYQHPQAWKLDFGRDMSEALDGYIEAIEKIKKEYENGSNREG